MLKTKNLFEKNREGFHSLILREKVVLKERKLEVVMENQRIFEKIGLIFQKPVNSRFVNKDHGRYNTSLKINKFIELEQMKENNRLQNQINKVYF